MLVLCFVIIAHLVRPVLMLWFNAECRQTDMFPAKRGFLNGNLDIESHIYLFNLKSIATKETQTALKMHCMFIAWSKIQKYWLYVFFF